MNNGVSDSVHRDLQILYMVTTSLSPTRSGQQRVMFLYTVSTICAKGYVTEEYQSLGLFDISVDGMKIAWSHYTV